MFSLKRCIWGCLGATLFAGLTAGPLSVGTTSSRPIAYTRTTEYNPAAWLTGADRFPAGARIFILGSEGTRPLTSALYASADPTVSFDGKHLLFAGRPTDKDRWQIFESDFEGGTPRLITTCEADCIRPLYLPDGNIVFTEIGSATSVVKSMPLAGGDAQQITFGSGRFLTDEVLRDGRIVIEAERTFDKRRVRELYTVYPDGSGFESLRCDHGSDRWSAHEIAAHEIVFVSNGKLARFTSASAAEQPSPQPSGDLSGAPANDADGHWFISVRGRRDKRFNLQEFDPSSRAQRPIFTESNFHLVQPVVVAAQEPPKRFPSALVPDRGAANVLCLNVHATRDSAIADTVQKVRVYTQDKAGRSVRLGETNVESDGSFFVQIPGEVPVRMELVDAAGKTVRSDKHGFWMRTGEQRVCVGCHAGPERAPENATPAVLMRSDVPVKMTFNKESK